MNILVTLDRNYLPPLRVMLGSLLRNDPRETFDIYTIGDGLRPEDWAGLEELCGEQGHIHPVEVPADLFADAPVARYWTRAMYYRLLAAELLPRSLDRVLYLETRGHSSLLMEMDGNGQARPLSPHLPGRQRRSFAVKLHRCRTGPVPYQTSFRKLYSRFIPPFCKHEQIASRPMAMSRASRDLDLLLL